MCVWFYLMMSPLVFPSEFWLILRLLWKKGFSFFLSLCCCCCWLMRSNGLVAHYIDRFVMAIVGRSSISGWCTISAGYLGWWSVWDASCCWCWWGQATANWSESSDSTDSAESSAWCGITGARESRWTKISGTGRVHVRWCRWIIAAIWDWIAWMLLTFSGNSGQTNTGNTQCTANETKKQKKNTNYCQSHTHTPTHVLFHVFFFFWSFATLTRVPRHQL